MKTRDQSNVLPFPDVIEDLNRYRIYMALMEMDGNDEHHALHQITDGLIEYFQSIDDPWADPCTLKIIELKALIDEMFSSLE